MTTIRNANINDAREIARVHVEGWRTAYRGLMPDDFLDGLDESERRKKWVEILTKDAPTEFNIVAEHQGRIVGFASGGPERKSDPKFSGELYGIYLLEEFRRQGIGGDLLRQSFELLQSLGLNSMKVWVLHDSPFRKFYEKHGAVLLADEETVTIGDLDLAHSAYGWCELKKAT